MRIFGAVLMTIGAAIALLSFTMNTSVTAYSDAFAMGGRTVNLGLLQSQMMVLQTGLAMFIAGAVLVAAPQYESGRRTSPSETSEERDRRFDEEDQRESRASFLLMVSGLVVATIIVLLLVMGASR